MPIPILQPIYRVDVEFVEELTTQEITEKISQLMHPQVIMWYIGCYGLRKTGVQFYKNFLISPVLKQSAQAIFWLVDLTAWGAFKNPQCSIDKFNHCCDVIEQLPTTQIKCIKSSDIFKKINELSDTELINYFRTMLQKNFISLASKHFPQKGINISDVFSSNCLVISDLNEYDANHAYSIIQYLEGCLLVDAIITSAIVNNLKDNMEIVFVLPNDETKYYKDDENSFQKDILFLLTKKCASLNIKKFDLRIKFLSFKYGTQLQHRPYNAPGEVLSKRELSAEDIIGNDNIIDTACNRMVKCLR